jgi:PAS domain S-box-containing protein
VSRADLPAALAIRGTEGVVEGTDYRGKRVLAATRRVPDSPWFLVAKVDRDEVLSPLRRDAWYSALLMLATLLLAGLFADRTWRRERRAAARALDATEAVSARLAAAITQAPVSVVVTDPGAAIIYVNPAFERLTGYTAAEAIGQNTRLLKSGKHDVEFYRQMWETLLRGEVWTGRLINRRKDGTLFTEEARIAPVHDTAGSLVNYVAVKRDVTSEMELQERLLSAEKMEAIGRLAGGVAHDFNNLLGIITGYADLAQRGLPADDPVYSKLGQIGKAAERAAGLTRQLLAFSRKQILQPRVLDLNLLVSEMEKMLQRLVREDIQLVVTLSPRVGNVTADPAQIQQVLLNLVANARDAMPGGGRLGIRTASAEFDAAYAASHPPARPGRYVMLAVSDTGEGMSAEIQARLFEPFFTTKELGKGTGLGLATVYGVVKQSGGHIFVYSEPGLGTTFKIYLPLVEQDATMEPLETEAAEGVRGSETILVAEDEPMLREVVREALAGEGYRVLLARDAAEALQTADEHQGEIHLLLSDVVMPGFTGVDVAEQLRPTRPRMKVLFISGYADAPMLQWGRIGVRPAFLGKPFGSGQLLRKVRAVLDERS